jgi:hypothetical protein
MKLLIFAMFAMAIFWGCCSKRENQKRVLYDMRFLNGTNNDIQVNSAEQSQQNFRCGILGANKAYHAGSGPYEKELNYPFILEIVDVWDSSNGTFYEDQPKFYITVPKLHLDDYNGRTIIFEVISKQEVTVTFEDSEFYQKLLKKD